VVITSRVNCYLYLLYFITWKVTFYFPTWVLAITWAFWALHLAEIVDFPFFPILKAEIQQL